MKTVQYLFILLLFLGLDIHQSFSQGEVADSIKITFKNERSFGIFLNSNGWGFNYMYGKRQDEFKKTLKEIAFSLVKDHREAKQESYQQPTNRFVFGKLANCFTLRYGIGQQREIYSKFDKGGIAIRYFYSGGATLMFLKPIYYDYLYQVNPIIIKTDKFDDITNKDPSTIISTNGFMKGLNETKIIPGIYCKAGLSFEYSPREELMNAIEIGGYFDLYAKQIKFLDEATSYPFVMGLFVCYRFGRIVKGSL